jgi:2-methylcitrate dehydratase PrpD
VWRTGQRTSTALAAFANSAYAGALDFDSLHTEGAVHADLVIVPTVLAVAQRNGLDGASVLRGIALGDDLVCRLALCTRENRGWFYTSLYGGMACAAVAAMLHGADAPTIAHAMGLAYLNAGGTQQPASERSPSKRVQGAMSLLVGMAAADLALAGLAGPQDIFSGKFGLFGMYERGQADGLCEGLGRRFEGERISYKAFPVCQCSHAVADTLLRVRAQHRLQAEQIESVVVRISPYMDRLVGAPFMPGATPQIDAQFSLQYCVARILLTGRLGIEEIREDAVRDPRALELARRVRIEVDAANTGKYAPAELALRLADGGVLEATAGDFPGSAEQPMSDAQVADKFGACLAAGRAEPTRAEVLLTTLYQAERHDSATLLARIVDCCL